MLLYNENNQPIDYGSLKAELIADADQFSERSSITGDEIEQDLGTYYTQALALEAEHYAFQPFTLETADRSAFSIGLLGRRILKKIRDFICGILTADSSKDTIVNAVLEAIASIIPGGIIIRFFVKKLVRFLVSLGIGKFCAA